MKNHCPKARDEKKLRDGLSDNLQALEPIDLKKCHSVNDIVKALAKTSFGGRALGEAANILYEMTTNPDCFVVGTFAGAMTMAKMGLVLCEMIDHGMINAVITTGALMAHGFVEASGLAHFKYTKEMNDSELYQAGYNRVYDTLELEKNLDDIEKIVNKVIENIDANETLFSQKICYYLGKYLVENTKGRGILKSAYLKNIPVYIPAFTDSELGLDFGIFRRKRKLINRPFPAFDPFLDLEHFTNLIINQKELGIFTVGGGVPRNWAQQVGPYLDIIQKRVKVGGHFKRYKYGVRICPEPAHWGGLSGCTYSEGISWGKFTPLSEGGKYAEVYADATIAWPFIVKAVMERLKIRVKGLGERVL